MKTQTKRLVSLLCAVLMAFGLLSGVTLPAAVAVSLTNNDVIVNLSWTESTVPATYTYQGKTYNLTWGTNAFSVLQTAVDTVTAGANVILCPGTYSATTTVKKNLTILGPKAGIDPNVRGAKYTDDWTMSSQRGSSEANLTGVWHLGVNGATVYSACTAVTVDGITVSGDGQLRSNSGTAGHATITLRNFILNNLTKNTQAIFLRTFYGDTNSYIRNIVIENFRIKGTAASQPFAIAADSLDMSGIYVSAGYEKPLFDALGTSWADASTDAVTFRIHDCMFRDAGINRPVYMNVQTGAITASSKSLNQDIAEKNRVTLKADHNVFIQPDTGVSSVNYSLAYALNTGNVYIEATDNTFYSTTATADSYHAVAIYATDTSLTYADKVTVRKNRFIGVSNAYTFSQAGGTVDLTGNYYESINGTVSAPVAPSGSPISCNWYYTDRDLVGKTTDPTPRFDQTDDDIVVCAAWSSSMPSTYSFEDHIYTLSAGVNAFSDLQTAIDATPSGGTLIIGPGTYGEANFTKAITVRGAMAGYSPNAEGATYMDDWDLSAKWNGAQTIVNGIWTFSEDSVVDGITLTGGGRLKDNGIASSATIEWRNLLLTGCTGSTQPLYAYHSPSNVLSRNITIEDVRIIGQTGANCIYFRGNTLTVRRVYIDDTSNKKLIDGLPLDNNNLDANITISDCMFRTVSTQVINARARNNSDTNTSVDNKSKVTIDLQNNVFYHTNTTATSTNNAIAIQWSSEKTYLNITGNTIVGNAPPSAFTGIAAYAVKDSNTNAFGSLGGQFVITRNRFINVPVAVSLGSYSTTNIPLDGNYYETAAGAAVAPTKSGTVSLNWYYLDRAMTLRSDGEAPEEIVPADRLYDIETEVRWFGRTYVGSNAEHFFNWTSSGFEFKFHGTGATARLLSSNPGGTNTAYLAVYIDGVRQSPDIKMTFSKNDVVLASGLSNGNHTVKVVKRTNGRSSTAALSRLWISEGSTKLAPPEAPCRKMQFIGDSITVGYGAIGSGATSWSTDTEDGTVTYAALTAQYFNADNQTIAISGRGIVRNTGGDTKKLMPVMYRCIDYTMCPDYEPVASNKLYDHSLYQADVVVINLGTNDAGSNNSDLTSAEYKAGCKAFIQQVRAAQPNAIIIYAYEFMNSKYGTEASQAVSELYAAGDHNVYYLKLATITTNEKHLGHPNNAAHADRANTLIAKVAELTGWDQNGGHSWNSGVVTTPASCTSTGVRTFTCTSCGATKTVDIPVTAHTWASDYTVDIEPTNTTEGRQSIHCTVCGAVKPGSIVIIPALYVKSDLFNLTVSNAEVSNWHGLDDRFSIFCTFGISGTEALANEPHDVKVLEYGVLYGTSMDAVAEFITYERTGEDTSNLPVVRYIYGASDTGVTRVYSSFSYRFKNIKAERERGMALYIRYECDTEIYVEYSAVGGAATYAGGYINGVGPTIVASDGLDD